MSLMVQQLQDMNQKRFFNDQESMKSRGIRYVNAYKLNCDESSYAIRSVRDIVNFYFQYVKKCYSFDSDPELFTSLLFHVTKIGTMDVLINCMDVDSMVMVMVMIYRMIEKEW